MTTLRIRFTGPVGKRGRPKGSRNPSQPTPETLECRICHNVLPTSEFYPRSTGGFMGECATCSKRITVKNSMKRRIRNQGMPAFLEYVHRQEELLQMMYEILQEEGCEP